MLLPIIMIFGIMYLLVIRPQTKRMKAHQSFVGGLKKGDEVLTSGGILGTIVGLTNEYVTLQVADDVNLRVVRSQVTATPKRENEK
ncbi:MAG: preprotein translocase subunit YajC [Bdellovibrionaceae bacterium]|nr:preprotein translocase subunit YajC [Pseudobdellovibrionaceae bacterium]